MEDNKNLMKDNMSSDCGMLAETTAKATGSDLTVDINGVTISYDDFGTGKIPVIFLHGFPFDKSSWQPQMDFLKKTHRVIAYDIRGYGKSTDNKDVKNMSLFANDLIKFMDALKIEHAIVCGLSMGGYILLNAESKFAIRFKALVLCDTQCVPDTAEVKEKRHRTIAHIIAGRVDDFAYLFIKNVFCQQTHDTQKELVERTKNIILSTSPNTIIAGLKALEMRWETCTSLVDIMVPVLIMCGREDIITPPSESEHMHSCIPNSTLRIINNAGHLSNLEKPVEFNAHLQEFIDGL